MVALLRSWGVSVTGSALGGLSYGFAGPILFQYANVIFLVGAAWMPLGLRAIDRWLTQGKRGALIELALVLSMQVLGGDLQSAYLLGVIAALYGVWLFQPRPEAVRWALLVGLVIVFYGLQLWLAGRIEASLKADTAAGESRQAGTAWRRGVSLWRPGLSRSRSWFAAGGRCCAGWWDLPRQACWAWRSRPCSSGR